VLGALDFADIADVYVSARPPRTDGNPLLVTLMLAIALELALKAVLRKDGATEKRLKRLGHDVEAAYRLVGKRHAPPRLRRTAARARVLRHLTAYYKEKYLEYTPVGMYSPPKLYVLRGMVFEAIRFALDYAYGPHTYARRRNARGVKIGASQAAYGNASKRALFRHQLAAFQRIAEALP
jgi:hypothetical protein